MKTTRIILLGVVIGMHVVMPAQATTMFECVRATSLSFVSKIGVDSLYQYVWTPRVRSAAVWTGAGMCAGMLLGLSSAAGEQASFFAILYRVILGLCTGGCAGFGVQHYRRWKVDVDRREQDIATKEAALETIQLAASKEVSCAGTELKETQEVLSGRGCALEQKVRELEEKINGCGRELMLKVDGVDARVNMGAQAEDMVNLQRDVQQVRETIGKIVRAQYDRAAKALALQELAAFQKDLHSRTDVRFALHK